MHDKFITPKEFSQLSGIDIKVIAAMRCNGGGPIYIKFGFAVRYRLSDVQAWLEKRRSDSAGHSKNTR